jgi:hypothetical protein
MTELAYLKRIKNKAKSCVKRAQYKGGLEPGDGEHVLSQYLLHDLEKAIEKYEKFLKGQKSAKKKGR